MPLWWLSSEYLMGMKWSILINLRGMSSFHINAVSHFAHLFRFTCKWLKYNFDYSIVPQWRLFA
jgi:hypothetical protein